MRNLTLAIALLGALACVDAAAPARPPDITGEITRVSGTAGGTLVLVEERPGEAAGGHKASVAIDGTTRVLRTSGGRAERADAAVLRVGSRVSVWFAGPVAQSYPVQGKAEAVLINGSP